MNVPAKTVSDFSLGVEGESAKDCISIDLVAPSHTSKEYQDPAGN